MQALLTASRASFCQNFFASGTGLVAVREVVQAVRAVYRGATGHPRRERHPGREPLGSAPFARQAAHSAQLRIIQTILTTPSNSIDETEGLKAVEAALRASLHNFNTLLTTMPADKKKKPKACCFGLCVASSVADSVADAATPTRTA